jgi:hypothetical protein
VRFRYLDGLVRVDPASVVGAEDRCIFSGGAMTIMQSFVKPLFCKPRVILGKLGVFLPASEKRPLGHAFSDGRMPLLHLPEA